MWNLPGRGPSHSQTSLLHQGHASQSKVPRGGPDKPQVLSTLLHTHCLPAGPCAGLTGAAAGTSELKCVPDPRTWPENLPEPTAGTLVPGQCNVSMKAGDLGWCSRNLPAGCQEAVNRGPRSWQSPSQVRSAASRGGPRGATGGPCVPGYTRRRACAFTGPASVPGVRCGLHLNTSRATAAPGGVRQGSRT